MSRNPSCKSPVDNPASVSQAQNPNKSAQGEEVKGPRSLEDIEEEPTTAPWKALFYCTPKQNLPLLAIAIVSAILAAAATPAESHFSGVIFGAFTKHAAGKTSGDELMNALRWPVTYLVIIGCGSWVMHFIMMSTWLAFGELQAKSARESLFEGLLSKDSEWYDRRTNGIAAILPRLQAQVRDLQLATAQPLGSVVGLASVSIMSFAQSLIYSWKLTLVTLASAPVIMAFMLWIGAGMGPHIAKQNDRMSEAQKFANNAFAAIETVKCFNGQSHELSKFVSRIQEAASSYVRIANRSGIQMASVAFLMTTIFVQGFYYGGVLIRNGEKTVAQVITTFLACISAFASLEGILPQLVVLEKGRAAGMILHSIIAVDEGTYPSIEGRKDLETPSSCRGDIEVRNVTFAYPAQPDQLALDNVSVYIPKGEITFLIGRSGSGKSTLGQLLMRFYQTNHGTISIDGRLLESLDISWLRSNITLVEQTSVLFDDTAFRNISFGSKQHADVTREDVVAAIEFALLRSMISDLPDGLNTVVGSKGGAMSGGQRQRMALARARLRDAPILILDESTSALDHITRTLMMDAVRQWRKDKTTIVVTHDITQIGTEDYAIVLEKGQLVQEGYRKHMEKLPNTPFQKFLSKAEEKHNSTNGHARNSSSVATQFSDDSNVLKPSDTGSGSLHTVGFDRIEARLNPAASKRVSLIPMVYQQGSPRMGTRSFAQASPLLRAAAFPALRHAPKQARNTSHGHGLEPSEVTTDISLVEQTGRAAAHSRVARHERKQWSVHQDNDSEHDVETKQKFKNNAIFQKLCPLLRPRPMQKKAVPSTAKDILSTVWPHINRKQKFLLIIGFYACTAHAVATPVFSYISSKLLATYARPKEMEHQAFIWAMTLLALAAVDSSHCYMERMSLEYVGECWVDNIRSKAMERVLDQPRDFFDKEENAVSRMVECLDRNAEEMRNLLGRFAGMIYTAAIMVVCSLIWAFSAQWKMTLIALAIGPYIAFVTHAYAHTSEKWEAKSNDACEVANAIYHEVFTNLKTVRALTLEPYFRTKLRTATREALRIGLHRSLYTGFFYALSDSSGIFVTATLFFVGGKVAQAGANVVDVVQVFTLLLFTVTNVGAILDYVPQIGAAKDTGSRLLRLSMLPEDSHEHRGDTRIASIGEVRFNNLRFAYPSRPDVTVLIDINLCIEPGCCIAIVGGSGSGKSTIANLLLKLYPTTKMGQLEFAGRDIQTIDSRSLRSLITVVSQTPTLFPATVAENIGFGLPQYAAGLGLGGIERAAREAGIHEFIASLPQGYDTVIGDGGMGLSGGQAQRIAIARAIVRRPSVLILDEATSALDVESANLVRQAVQELVSEVTRSMTVIIITHHRDMMEIADRIVVLDQGRVVEEGGFKELLRKGGPLSHLLSGGEWDKDRKSRAHLSIS